MINDNITCKNHDDLLFLFYCFDDHCFLCHECFREHREHKLEIKTDLKKVEEFISLLKKSGVNDMKRFLEDSEKNLKQLKTEAEQILLEIHYLLETLNNIEENKNIENISDIKYGDYKSLFNISNIKKNVNEIYSKGSLILKRLKNLSTEFIIPTKFNFINKEVKVLDNTETVKDYPVDILLGKSKINQFTLFNLVKQHYLCIDLNKKYYLNSIRIQTTTASCSVKHFDVLIKDTDNKSDNWIKIKKFTKTKEIKDNQYQSFDIGIFVRLIKLIFFDNWGLENGNYILIKSIDFEVGE